MTKATHYSNGSMIRSYSDIVASTVGGGCVSATGGTGGCGSSGNIYIERVYKNECDPRNRKLSTSSPELVTAGRSVEASINDGRSHQTFEEQMAGYCFEHTHDKFTSPVPWHRR